MVAPRLDEILAQLCEVVRASYGVNPTRVKVFVAERGKSLLLPCPPPCRANSTPEPANGPRPEPKGCAGDILRVLREVGQRLSCPAILEEMAERGLEWSERSVRRWLAALQQQGVVDLDERAQPPGYGLTEWH